MEIRAISWNLFHGRDAPPDHALFTRRSKLLRITERDETHVQVNRDLYSEFERLVAGSEWDVILLQECPPRWGAPLADASGAGAHRSLTSRNAVPPLQGLLHRLNPDLVGSWEGGSNVTLARGIRIVERRELEIQRHPERRVMQFTSLESGICVANLHASNNDPGRAIAEVRRAAETAAEWAGDAPLIFGGDLNLRPPGTEIFGELEQRFGLAPPTAPTAIDHLLARGIEVLEPPRQWPAEAREIPSNGLALRLSDHAPVEALFGPPSSTRAR